MKTWKTIYEEMEKNTSRAKAADAAADALYKKDEVRNAETPADRVRLHKSITEADETRAAELYAEAENLKSLNKILSESARASFAKEAADIIRGIMAKYSGKQYGEKTRAKIQDEAHAAGIGFYFDGYSEKNTVHVYTMNAESGYKSFSGPEVILLAVADENHRAAFIDASNKIADFSGLEFSHSYKYTESPAAKQKELETLFETFKTAYEAAKAAQDALNTAIPDSWKRFDAIGYLSPWQRV